MSGKRKESGKPRDYTVGKGKPPEEHQFRPGVSGNYNGRRGNKKKEPATYLADLPSQRMFLDEGMRLVRVRSGEGTEELPTLKVVMRSLAADAMKPGHIMAKRAYRTWYIEAEREEFAQRRQIFEYWHDYVGKGRARLDRARTAGDPEPRLLPHPDDIKFGYDDLTVKFLGPMDETEAERFDRACRLKDLMYEMSLFDPPEVENAGDVPLGQRWIGFWTLHYFMFVASLPPRLRGLPDEVELGIEERIFWRHRRWRAYLEERFAAEGIPFVLTGHREKLVFRLDDLMEQAWCPEGWCP